MTNRGTTSLILVDLFEIINYCVELVGSNPVLLASSDSFGVKLLLVRRVTSIGFLFILND